MPDSFAQSDAGVLLAANGVQRPLRWAGRPGLADDAGVAAPTTAPTVAFSSGTTARSAVVYRAYVRFVTADGAYSDLSPVADEIAVEFVSGTFTYTGVARSDDRRVVRRQILRNTGGQAYVYYVDVDTTDLSATTFTSTNTDAVLLTKTAVPLFGTGAEDLANRFGLPPSDKPLVASHLGRMWLGGTLTYTEGSAALTDGSATVTGHGTAWTEEMAGRYLFVAGQEEGLEISAVDEAAQTLTLAAAFDGTTDPFAAYAIRPAPAYLPLVYFSGVGLPDAWPATAALQVPTDGDDLTGMLALGSFLYLFKRRRTYRLTAQGDPGNDGYIFPSAGRGCVNHRAFAVVGDVAYVLDEGGVWAFDGGQARPISDPVQTLFRPTAAAGPRVNWAASRWFHACHDPAGQRVLFFVTLYGEYLPRHALCYGYAADKWWLEEYPFPVGASCLGRAGRPTAGWADRGERVFLGGPGGRVFAFDGSPLDVAAPAATNRGRVRSAGVASLTVAGPLPDLTGVPVAVASGRGAGQVRVVASNTATVLRLDRPWRVKPDATSTYQIGGVAYRWATHLMRLAPAQQADGRDAEVTFAPSDNPARVSLSFDRAAPAPNARTLAGVRTAATKDDLAVEVDMGAADGAALLRFPGHRERTAGGRRYVRVAASGVSGDPPAAFGELTVNGVL